MFIHLCGTKLRYTFPQALLRDRHCMVQVDRTRGLHLVLLIALGRARLPRQRWFESVPLQHAASVQCALLQVMHGCRRAALATNRRGRFSLGSRRRAQIWRARDSALESRWRILVNLSRLHLTLSTA